MENINNRHFGPSCPFCGNPLAPGAKKCYHCGYDREETMKTAQEHGCVKTIIIIVVAAILGYLIVEFIHSSVKNRYKTIEINQIEYKNQQ